jgi:NAD(P)-dependent dehydrogenase (short-subunit alcohol dehydrogenase family)
LGKAVSQAFLAEGTKVVVGYRTPGEFSALWSEVGELASPLEDQPVDVTDEAGVSLGQLQGHAQC